MAAHLPSPRTRAPNNQLSPESGPPRNLNQKSLPNSTHLGQPIWACVKMGGCPIPLQTKAQRYLPIWVPSVPSCQDRLQLRPESGPKPRSPEGFGAPGAGRTELRGCRRIHTQYGNISSWTSLSSRKMGTTCYAASRVRLSPLMDRTSVFAHGWQLSSPCRLGPCEGLDSTSDTEITVCFCK